METAAAAAVLPETSAQEFTDTDALAELKKGTVMLLYGRSGRPHFRFVRLDARGTELRVYRGMNSYKPLRKVILRYSRLVLGMRTAAFRRFPNALLEGQSFSLVFGRRSNKTLDIICKCMNEFNAWTTKLQGLVKH